MERLEALHKWVNSTLGRDDLEFTPASSDASFRRYFRVNFPDGQPSLVVMDAPPDREDCRPYLKVAEVLCAAGVHVPTIHARNLELGFLLLSDLGTTTYLDALRSSDPAVLYGDAIDALVRIQATSRPGVLPDYSRQLLARELELFPEWYVGKQLSTSLSESQRAKLDRGFDLLLANNLAQPQVFVHRDFHSRNLMVSTPNPGVLDFQDAVYGPITYDLVSLLRDAYISWPEAQVIDWCVRYWEKARKAGLPVNTDFALFYRDFEWMGAQRQIKVLGIFARLCYRDGKSDYLQDQPLVMAYLRKTCERYGELDPILQLLDELTSVENKVGYTF